MRPRNASAVLLVSPFRDRSTTTQNRDYISPPTNRPVPSNRGVQATSIKLGACGVTPCSLTSGINSSLPSLSGSSAALLRTHDRCGRHCNRLQSAIFVSSIFSTQKCRKGCQKPTQIDKINHRFPVHDLDISGKIIPDLYDLL